jgi:uncharacterized cupin superfamily protein
MTVFRRSPVAKGAYNMANPPISVFRTRSEEPTVGVLDGWEPAEGNPTMRWWREYVADDESVRCAWWEATPGTYNVIYDAWEFIHLLEGKITITPDGDEPRHVGASDTFIIEKGFRGTWKIEEKVLKVCAFKVK